MPTPRETILAALHQRLSALPATALRGEVLPERVPAEGLLILRDGEPGEPDVTLSPLRYAEGVLTSDRITETDILDGRWDNAEVEVWRVNWADTGQRVLMRRGAIGQIRRGRLAFVAEVRSLAHVLGQTVGRTFQATCDAALGDTRCGVDLEDTAFKGTGAVIDVLRDRAFTASGLGGFASGWFTFGTLDWTTGANAGRPTEVLGHDVTDGIAVLTLLEAPVWSIGGSIGGAILGVSAATIGGFIGSSIGSVVDSWIISSLVPTQRIEGARLDTLRIRLSGGAGLSGPPRGCAVHPRFRHQDRIRGGLVGVFRAPAGRWQRRRVLPPRPALGRSADRRAGERHGPDTVWRSRALAADSWGGLEVPLGEEFEAYEVEILDGAAVKRLLSASTTSALYTAAQQTADWGALLGPGDSLAVRIFQLTALVGRGAPKAVTLSF